MVEGAPCSSVLVVVLPVSVARALPLQVVQLRGLVVTSRLRPEREPRQVAAPLRFAVPMQGWLGGVDALYFHRAPLKTAIVVPFVSDLAWPQVDGVGASFSQLGVALLVRAAQ